MKRNLTISTNVTDPGQNIVSIKDIGGIVNYSTDLVLCDTLESIEPNNLQSFISQLLNKVRPSGYVVFKFLDTKKICAEFLSNKISTENFVNYFNSKNNLVTLDTLYSLLDTKTFAIMKVQQEQDSISLTIQRMSV